jgi:hypothetical protein
MQFHTPVEAHEGKMSITSHEMGWITHRDAASDEPSNLCALRWKLEMFVYDINYAALRP